MFRHVLCLTSVVCVVFSAAHADASIMMDPPFDMAAAGLNPGDPYHLIFVTKGTRNAMSYDIGVYNAFVREEAEGIGYATDPTTKGWGIDWFAIASTADNPATATVDEAVNAKDNVPVVDGVPIFLLDGSKVVYGSSDSLWDGGVLSALSVNQFGDDYAGGVFTGTNPDGTRNVTHPLGGVGWDRAKSGLSYEVNGWWVTWSWPRKDNSFPYYAISEQLQTTPEPTSAVAWLTLTGCGLLWAWRRRRKQTH